MESAKAKKVERHLKSALAAMRGGKSRSRSASPVRKEKKERKKPVPKMKDSGLDQSSKIIKKF